MHLVPAVLTGSGMCATASLRSVHDCCLNSLRELLACVGCDSDLLGSQHLGSLHLQPNPIHFKLSHALRGSIPLFCLAHPPDMI